MLRPYQVKAEAEIFEAWKEGYRSIMFQLVTGGGKTVLFVSIIRKFLMAGKRVILVAHREELINQAWEHLKRREVWAGIIKSKVPERFDLPCQVGSIQTMSRRKHLPPADLIIFDEGHHSQDDNSYGNLLIQHYPNARVLSVTATPYRLSGKGFTDLYQKLIKSITFKELVESGYLAPLRYFRCANPNLNKLHVQGGDYVVEEAAEAMALVPLVDSYLEHCNGMSGVVFAVNVGHSNQIVSQYLAHGISAAHLDANTPTELRREILARFKSGKLKIISNVGIITEGFDFPDMQFVQLARPTKSLSLYLQMVGRVTRVVQEAIQDATDDEDRRLRVASSRKPFGYVLDNAGLYKEHGGLPDQDFDWDSHFRGQPKKKKKKITELIEILEFVAEDKDGRTVRTNIPEEIEGLRLIEVNKHIEEIGKTVNLTSLKEFDRLLAMFSNMAAKPNANIKKPGFVAFSQYKDYCRKNSYLMNAEVWDYLIKRLHVEPGELEQKAIENRERTILAVRDQYAGDGPEIDRLSSVIIEQTKKALANFQRYHVSEGFLKKERAEYMASLKTEVPA